MSNTSIKSIYQGRKGNFETNYYIIEEWDDLTAASTFALYCERALVTNDKKDYQASHIEVHTFIDMVSDFVARGDKAWAFRQSKQYDAPIEWRNK